MFSIASGQFNVLTGEVKSPGDPFKKINFDLNQLNEQGLRGPPDGLRALAYEFCIPADPVLSARVKAIDPTVVIYPGQKEESGVPGKNISVLVIPINRSFGRSFLNLLACLLSNRSTSVFLSRFNLSS